MTKPIVATPPVTLPKKDAAGYVLVIKDQQSGRKLAGAKVTVAGLSGNYLSDDSGEVRLKVRSKSELNGLRVEFGEFGVADQLLGTKKGWVYLAKVNTTAQPVVPMVKPISKPEPKVEPKKVLINPAPKKGTDSQRSSGTSTIETASMTLPWVNSLGMEFVPVPGTSVLFCRWETSQLNFAKFTGNEDQIGKRATANHPVGYISWVKAMAFCEWLTRRERELGLITAGQLYRLPRDVEWSQAVGMPPENGVTPYGRKERSPIHHPNWSESLRTLGGNYSDESTYEKYGASGNRVYLHRFHKNFRYRDGFADTAPVNSFNGNLYGIHNLGGNIAEWCLDQYGGPGYTSSQHYLRGGSFMDGYLTLTYSGARMPIDSFNEGRHPQHGFRVVLDKGRR
ncbi:MAG: formylglycine-generating enzyme family protein [Limisphaerales bacterium]